MKNKMKYSLIALLTLIFSISAHAQEPAQVIRELEDGLVATLWILGERLHHDPIELALQGSAQCASR